MTRTPSKRPSGPKPPPSWDRSRHSSRTNIDVERNTPRWRNEALSLLMREARFEEGPSNDLIWELDERQAQRQRVVPSLRHLCLQRCATSDLATLYPSKYISSLPPHIRLLLARYAAIISPLGLRASKAIWGSDGHALGEAILVGSSRTTRWINEEDMEGISNILFCGRSSESDVNVPGDWSWDEVDQSDSLPSIQTNVDIQGPLTSLFILHIPLSDIIFSRLPHTLIHLSLVALPSTAAPPPLRLLMRSLPLLRTLDISHNHHLAQFDRIVLLPWESRWKDMNVLGMRHCWSSEELATKCVGIINSKRPGRWIKTVVYPTYQGP